MNQFINPLSAVLLFCSIDAHALTGYLENPVAGAIESGISVVSGWHCTAQTITMTIDGQDFGNVGSGTNRFDTEPVCGHPRTGFSRLISWSALPEGSHTLSVYADGVLLDTRQFNTVRSGGQPFATGLAATFTLSNFPVARQSEALGSSSLAGQSATLEWREAKQSFVVTRIEGDSGSGATPETLVPVLVSAGDIDRSARVSGELPTVIRSTQDYSRILPGIAASMPPGYLEPDFSRANLYYLSTPNDENPNSYIRIVKVESSPEGSQHVVLVEYCGVTDESFGMSNHAGYALYSVPVVTGVVRFHWIESYQNVPAEWVTYYPPCVTAK